MGIPSIVVADLRINEVYPAPESGQSEWIEIYNPLQTIIDLTEYRLEDEKGNEIQFITEEILSVDYAIAESSRVLNNGGDSVFLFKSQQLVDQTSYPGGLTSEESYAYCSNENTWKISATTTKGTKNDYVCNIPTTSSPGVSLSPIPTLIPTSAPEPTHTATPSQLPTSTPFPDPTHTGEPTQTIVPTETPPLTPTTTPTQIPSLTLTTTPSPTTTFTTTPTVAPISTSITSEQKQNIILNEAMVAPQTGENEWIEIYNNNSEQLSLEDWYIDDIIDGGSTPKSFSKILPAKSYTVIEISSSIFNNSEDHVRILDSTEQEITQLIYTDSEKGFSIGLNDQNTYCIQLPSKGLENYSCMTDKSANSSENDENDSVVSESESKSRTSDSSKEVDSQVSTFSTSEPSVSDMDTAQTTDFTTVRNSTKKTINPNSIEAYPYMASSTPNKESTSEESNSETIYVLGEETQQEQRLIEKNALWYVAVSFLSGSIILSIVAIALIIKKLNVIGYQGSTSERFNFKKI